MAVRSVAGIGRTGIAVGRPVWASSLEGFGITIIRSPYLPIVCSERRLKYQLPSLPKHSTYIHLANRFVLDFLFETLRDEPHGIVPRDICLFEKYLPDQFSKSLGDDDHFVHDSLMDFLDLVIKALQEGSPSER